MERQHLRSKAVSATFASVISGAELCTEHVNLIQVDDFKVDIKEDPHDEANAQNDENGVCTTVNETLSLMSNAKYEVEGLQSPQTLTNQKEQQGRFVVNLSECYYIKCLLVQCPACDTSYRGGRHQLPRLFKHVNKCHKRNCSRIIRSIKARYRVKKRCDCFACMYTKEAKH